MDLHTAIKMEANEMEKMRQSISQKSRSTCENAGPPTTDLISFDTPTPSLSNQLSSLITSANTSSNTSPGMRQSSSYPFFTPIMNSNKNINPVPLTLASDQDKGKTNGLIITEMGQSTGDRGQSVFDSRFSTRFTAVNSSAVFYNMTQRYSPVHYPMAKTNVPVNPQQETRLFRPSNPFASGSVFGAELSGRSSSPSSTALPATVDLPYNQEEKHSQQGDEINSIFESWLNDSTATSDEGNNKTIISISSPVAEWKEWDPLQRVPVSEIPPELPPKLSRSSQSSVSEKQSTTPKHDEDKQRLAISAQKQFFQMVVNVRNTLPHNDPLTNPGYLISPMMPKWQSALNSESGDYTIKISITKDGLESPMVFSCNINASVEHVLSQALCIVHDDINDVCVSEYSFKVTGKQEFLLSATTLNLYELVQNCVRFEEDLRLQLVHGNAVDMGLIRTESDDQTDVLSHLSKLMSKHSYSVTREDVDIVKSTFTTESQKLQEGCSSIPNLTTSQQCDRIVQSVRAVCQVLGEIETIPITEALNELRSSVEDVLNGTSSSENKRKCVTNAMDKLTPAVHAFLDMFCQATDLEVPCSDEENFLMCEDIYDFLDLNVVSVHRLPQMWSSMYEEYYISCELFYGSEPLCQPVNTQIVKYYQIFNSRISWNEWLTFPIKVCELPRETKICITLHGIPKRNDASKSEKLNAKELSWTSVQLFNHRLIMLPGGSLHSMKSASGTSKQDRTCGSCSTKITNNESIVVNIELLSSQSIGIKFPIYTLRMLSSGKMSSGQSISSLDEGTQEDLQRVWTRSRFLQLSDQERDLIWKHRLVEESTQYPGTLAQVLRCVPSWSPAELPSVYQILENCPPVSPVEAIELLSTAFPDQHVRSFAVRCIQQGEEDEIHDYINQLVQALKFETYYDNALAKFLLRSALGNIMICHKLYWLFTENASDGVFTDRYHLMLYALDVTIGAKLKKEFEKEKYLVKLIHRAAEAVKYAKDSSRNAVLQSELQKVNSTTKNHSFRLPTDPALVSNGIDVEKSSYFTSNSIPLRLTFNNAETSPKYFPVMYKVGDDIRQDVLTMQLVRIMDKLWLAEGLDLKIISFDCLSTGANRGFVELVPDSITLREIQSSYGLTGAFKDRPILEWLQRHNPTSITYKKAEENFTLSCAGYCVATYVLGICDRHNDNIMLRQTGQLFHIDFARFLGHAQMFGNIKRDRAPFVLTADMAYVINGGDRPSSRFHDFVDICCQAFNIIRKRTHLFINLLSLMTHSGIAELRQESDLKYVYDALKPAASDSEATAMFTRMIETSLASSFTRINFFIHNLAQIRFHGGESEDKKSLSFTSKFYKPEDEGMITSAVVVGYQKKYNPEKQYLFCVRILRELRSGECYVFRTFNEFYELHRKLEARYSSFKLPSFPNRVIVGRSQVKQVAEKRKYELNNYLHSLLNRNLGEYKNDLFCTFFHPILRDEQASTSPTKNLQKMKPNSCNVGGEIKLSVHHKSGALLVMVMHCRNLVSPDGSDPDPYVKAYLRPDTTGTTKRKTKVARKTFNPTYNEMIVYGIPLSTVDTKTLEISVWNYESLNENDFMGSVNLTLSMMDLRKDNTSWYPLTARLPMPHR